MAISTNSGRKMSHNFSSHDNRQLRKRHIQIKIPEKQFINRNKTVKFLVFRHPLSRFTSAHYEKLVTPYSYSFAQSNYFIRAKINLRKRILNRLGKLKNSTFPYVVEFSDFVEFVTKFKGGKVNDPHWRLQTRFGNFRTER